MKHTIDSQEDPTLTDKQIDQQDFIDDTITSIILSVKPDFVHDIETIGAIRDSFIPNMSRILGIPVDVIYP